jgi:hypothetical protein
MISFSVTASRGCSRGHIFKFNCFAHWRMREGSTSADRRRGAATQVIDGVRSEKYGVLRAIDGVRQVMGGVRGGKGGVRRLTDDGRSGKDGVRRLMGGLRVEKDDLRGGNDGGIRLGAAAVA